MATYQNTAKTRLSLIEAAGELFAEKGINAVTTREIAKKAGTVQNAITYHFGGISGLIEAVWAYVLIEWEPGSFGRYLKEHDRENAGPEEQRELVSDCIRFLFQIMYRADRPLWISKFLVRSAMSPDGDPDRFIGFLPLVTAAGQDGKHDKREQYNEFTHNGISSYKPTANNASRMVTSSSFRYNF